MKNTTTATTTTTSTETKLGWDTADIFTANLMFPTRHFNEEFDLKKLSEEEFSKLIIDILEPVQPLTNHERSELAKSVKSKLRLRVYYQALQVENRYLSVVNDVKENTCEDARLKDKFDHVHMQIGESIDSVEEQFISDEDL